MSRGKPPTLDYYRPRRRVANVWPASLDPRRPLLPSLATLSVFVAYLVSCGQLGPLLLPLVPFIGAWYILVRIFKFGARPAQAVGSRSWFRVVRLICVVGAVLGSVWCIQLWHRYYPSWVHGVWRRWWHPWIDLEPALQLFLAFALAMLVLDLVELVDRVRSRRVVAADERP